MSNAACPKQSVKHLQLADLDKGVHVIFFLPFEEDLAESDRLSYSNFRYLLGK